MDGDRIEEAAKLYREAAELLGSQGSFRLRTLIQMLLQELKREQALRDGKRGPPPES